MTMQEYGVPVPKFKRDQKVWEARVVQTQEPLSCPDCHDSRKWIATTAAGEQIEVVCPRCQGYGSPRDLPRLVRQVSEVNVVPLTIGSVRINTSDSHPISYMCYETGVGSGNIYYEGTGADHGLYGTEAQARNAAQVLSLKHQNELDAKPESIQASALAKLPLEVATVYKWQGDVYHAWDAARRYREDIDEVLESQMLDDDLRQTLEDSIVSRSWIRPHPVDTLIEAAENVLEAPEIVVVRSALRDAVKALKCPS